MGPLPCEAGGGRAAPPYVPGHLQTLLQQYLLMPPVRLSVLAVPWSPLGEGLLPVLE